MDLKELENYLHAQIPLTHHMQVRVMHSGPPGLQLSAPLAPNANLHGTAFGGSIASLAVLAGWCLLHIRCLENGLNCSLVVQKSEITYQHAIHADFTADCLEPDGQSWQRFMNVLARRGKSRITLEIQVRCGAQTAAVLHATYAATSLPSDAKE